MIPETTINELRPGRKLYRVLATTKKGEPITYRVATAHVKNVTPKNVTFMENTAATSRGLRQTKQWVSENMALSREGAWDQAADDMMKQHDANETEINRLTGAGERLLDEYQVLKNKGKRK